MRHTHYHLLVSLSLSPHRRQEEQKAAERASLVFVPLGTNSLSLSLSLSSLSLSAACSYGATLPVHLLQPLPPPTSYRSLIIPHFFIHTHRPHSPSPNSLKHTHTLSRNLTMEAMGGESAASALIRGDAIEVPVHGSVEESIEVDLREPLENIILVLTEERARPGLWLAIARHYYNTGARDKFVALLEAATAPSAVQEAADAAQRADSVRLHTLQVAHLLEVARGERDDAARKQLFAQATQLINRADRLDMYNSSSFLAKGFLKFAQGGKQGPERALENFSVVLTSEPRNIPALLGKAAVEYGMGRTKAALRGYRTVLRLLPHCPAGVRVGIGMCLARLGRVDTARAAFERAIELEPGNAHALAGLAVLTLNARDAESTQNGVHLLTKAYEADAGNPVALNHLADHFFHAQEHDKALKLAAFAEDAPGAVPSMRAESAYHIARVLHTQGDFDQAHKYYSQAVLRDPKLALAQYGQGQMYIARGQMDKAAACFEAVLKAHPDNYEGMRILGALYGSTAAAESSGKKNPKRLARAIELLERVVKARPDDVEAWLDLAARREGEPGPANARAALDAYAAAIDILTQLEHPVPPELLNNQACLYCRLGEASAALDTFSAADARCAALVGELPDVDDQAYFQGLRVTITYNTARLHELAGRIKDAEALYKEIVSNYPAYTDAQLRLGCLARDAGDVEGARTRFTSVVKSGSSSGAADAHTLLGNMHMHREQWKPAQEHFERVLKLPGTPYDSYALLSLGNIYLRADQLDRASSFFSKVLRAEKKNVYAASGIGCVLACKGHMSAAKDIFLTVREATGGEAEVVDAWLNLAHIYVQQGQFVEAVKLYETCLMKFLGGADVGVLGCLARAQFKAGKYVEALTALQRAAEHAPEDDRIIFNIALAKKAHAVTELKREGHSIDEVDTALAALSEAKDAFLGLHSSAMAKGKVKYDPARAKSEASACEDFISQGKTLQARAVEQQRKREALAAAQEESRKTAEKERKRKQLEEEQARAVREEERRQQIAMFEDQVAKSGALQDTVSTQKEKRKGGGGRKRKKSDADFIDDGMARDLANLSDASSSDISATEGPVDGLPAGVAAKQGAPKRSRKSKKERSKRRGKMAPLDEEEDGQKVRQALKSMPATNKRSLQNEDSSSSSDGEGAGDGDSYFSTEETNAIAREKAKSKAKAGAGKNSRKSKAIVSDSDSE